MAQSSSVVVHLTVKSASGIRDTSFFGIQAPYVIIQHGNDKRKTVVDQEGGTAPVWDETHRIQYVPGRHIHFTLKNSGFIYNKVIGKLTVHSEELEKFLEQADTEFTHCVPVLNFEKKRKGELEMMVRMQVLHGAQQQPAKKTWIQYISNPTFRKSTIPQQRPAEQSSVDDKTAKV